MQTKIWAHRGACKKAPENTLPAFALAMEMGADGLELDVQLTKDGQVVVLHDETVDRTSNGKGPISAYMLEEARRLDFSAGMPGFENVPIPTLAQVYALIAPGTMTINVEIKAGGEPDPAMERALLALETEYAMKDRLIYSSFNHNSLRSLKKVIPHAKLGLLYMCTLADPWDYARAVGADALHPYIRTSPADLVPQSQGRGIMVHPWTVDDDEVIRMLIAQGAEAIITNLPDKALALRG